MAAILIIIALLAGLYLLGRGWRGICTGTAPFCAACGYNLTGRVSDYCPECGASLEGDAILTGERRRRPGFLFAGAMLILVTILVVATGTAGRLARYDWYRLKPTPWVLKDANAPGVKLSLKAYRELARRTRAGSLNEQDCRQAAVIALAELEQKLPRLALEAAYVELLNELRLSGTLSKSQLDRLFEGILDLRLITRPESLAAVGIPALLQMSARTGNTDLSVNAESTQIVLTTEGIPHSYSGSSSFRGGGTCGSSTVVKVPGPGSYDVHTRIKLRVLGSPARNAPPTATLYAVEKTLTARSNALADEPPDFIQVVTDPKLEPIVNSAVRVNQLKWNPDATGIEIQLGIQNPPVDLAFQVKLLDDGREIASAPVGITRGSVTNRSTTIRCKFSDLREVDVVFAPDTNVAKRSVNLTRIWGKPIRVDRVPVKGLAPATASAPE